MNNKQQNTMSYYSTLFQKYGVNDNLLDTRTKKRAIGSVLEQIDKKNVHKNQKIDKSKIKKLRRAFSNVKWFKNIAASLTFATAISLFQAPPLEANIQVASISKIKQNFVSVSIDDDSSLQALDKQNDVGITKENIKTTSLHLVTNKAIFNEYETLKQNSVILDDDSDVTYMPQDEVKSLTVIDTTIEDWEILAKSVNTGSILLLKKDDNALDTMISELKKLGSVESLNIISHGSSGQLHFSDKTISSQTLEQNANKWKEIGSFLNKDGDILLYGCNVAQGEKGKEFIKELAELTQVDIGASVDLTGSYRKAGNWELEFVLGKVNSTNILNINKNFFTHVLAPFTGTVDFGTIVTAGSLAGNSSINSEFTAGAYTLIVDGNSQSTYHTAGSATSSGAESKITLKFSVDESFSVSEIDLRSSGTGVGEKWDITADVGAHSVAVTMTSSFVSVDLSGFSSAITKLYLTPQDGSGYYMYMDNFDVANVGGSLNTAPTITNATASQAVNDNATITPFSGVTLADADGDNLSVTIALDDNAKGTLSSTSIASTSVAAAQTALRAITFNPTDNRVAPGSTETTTFTITVNDGTTNSTPNNTTTVISTSVNDAPTDITLSSTSVAQSGGTNASVGTLGVTDADTGDTATYSLVAGTDDTNNGSFNISGTSLRANDSSALVAGTYKIRVNVNDGDANFEKAFTITVTDDVVPTLGAVSSANVLGTTADIKATPNETGNMYFVVTTSSSAPSATQVVVGQDENGAAATKAGTSAVTASTAKSFSVTGLSDSIQYYFYIVTVDSASNKSTVSNGTFTTTDTTAPSKSSSSPADDANTVSISANLTFTFSENIVLDTGSVVLYKADGTVVETFNVANGTGSAGGTIGVSTNTLTINPNSDLLSNESYYIQIATTAIKDSSGNSFAGINDATTWNFTADKPTVTLSKSSANIAENGGTATVTATLSSISKTPVTVTLATSGIANNPADYTLSSTSLEIAAGDTTATATLTGVDDSVTDIDETIIIDISSVVNGTESGTQQQTVTITDDDIPQIKTSKTTASVDENGTTDSFTVFLDNQPTTDVVIDISNNDTSEVTVDKTSLTFTNANYNTPQTVTLTGVDDASIDGNIQTAITLSINDASSDDMYDNSINKTVTVTTIDDENIAPVVTDINLTTPEDTNLSLSLTNFTNAFSDSDIGDSLDKIKFTSLGSNGVLKLNNTDITTNQEINSTQINNLVYVPNQEFNGDDSFTYQASDSKTYSNSASLGISVTLVNDAPVIYTVFNDINITEDNGTRNYELNVTDYEFDDINVTVESNNTDIIRVVQNWTNELQSQDYYNLLDFNLTTVQDATGIVQITIKAVDIDGATNEKTFDINVTAVNDSFSLQDFTKQVYYKGFDDKNLSLIANNPDQDENITYNISFSDSSLVNYTIQDDYLILTSPSTEKSGITDLNISATDGENNDTTSFKVQILLLKEGDDIKENGEINVTEEGNATVTTISFGTDLTVQTSDDTNGSKKATVQTSTTSTPTEASSTLNGATVEIIDSGLHLLFDEDTSNSLKAEANITTTGKTTHTLTLSDGNITQAISEAIGTKTFIQKVNNILQIVTSLSFNGSTISSKADENGTATHSVQKGTSTSTATSKLKGAKTLITSSGDVATTAGKMISNGSTIKAKVITDKDGKTITQFVQIDNNDNETVLENTLKTTSSYPIGNEVEIDMINNQLYIKTKTPLTSDITID